MTSKERTDYIAQAIRDDMLSHDGWQRDPWDVLSEAIKEDWRRTAKVAERAVLDVIREGLTGSTELR
jgi:hypothetical protein